MVWLESLQPPVYRNAPPVPFAGCTPGVCRHCLVVLPIHEGHVQEDVKAVQPAMDAALLRRPRHSCGDVLRGHGTGVRSAANVVPDAEQGAGNYKSSSGGEIDFATEKELMEEGHAHTSEGF